MAVHCYTGNLGGGKTISALQLALRTWKAGGFVYSNVDVYWDRVRAYGERVWGKRLQDQQFTMLKGDQISLFHRHVKRGTRTAPSIVIIDEAGKFFNSRNWRQNEQETADFLRESRKLHVEVIFISQEEDLLDKQMRLLIAYRWRFVDMKAFGNLPILRNYILQKQYHYETDVKISSKWWRKDSELFSLYDTDALVSDYAMALEEENKPLELEVVGVGTESRQSRMKGFYIILIALGVLAYHFLKPKDKAAKGSPAVEVAKVGKASPAPSLVPATPAPLYDLEVEELLSYTSVRTNGVTFNRLKTESDEYQVGELCAKGMVQAVRDSMAKVLRPNGRTVYVLGRVSPETHRGDSVAGDAESAAQSERTKQAIEEFRKDRGTHASAMPSNHFSL